MPKLFKLMLLSMLAISACPVSANEPSPLKPLEVGVVPYMSARALVTSYEPMRLYLERIIGRPVKIYTANGFSPFLQNAIKGVYDLVISPAHFARILQKEYRFMPLVRYSSGGRGLVMAAVNGPIKTIQDLRGHIIAVPDRLSLATIVCMTSLRESGLKPGADFHILYVPSFTSAILAVQKGDTDAAISAPGALAQMPQELRNSVTAVLDTGDYISLIFLASPRLNKSYVTLLNNALLKFGNDPDEGKQFLTSTGFGSIIPATENDMNSLDRYLPETKRLLKATP